MDCRSKRDFNLDDDEDDDCDYDHDHVDADDDHHHHENDDDDDGDDDEHSRQMDCRSKHDLNFNFLPTAPEWEECQFVNWRIGERTFPEWVNLSTLTSHLSISWRLRESENWRIRESNLSTLLTTAVHWPVYLLENRKI